ncbi:hypothetical protein BGW38_005041 [Lunasporangiospora selenospora]|uniref:DNA-(apurinic or apyrimidinic site) endonuclease n=1 Tax=Lunasporangiospora selenospora TaxID=979761 RepID=A0A9P6G2R7_9FUNG|nr:hypothetical protein BGW38_005041 [Lunasporangiospora selenospora]
MPLFSATATQKRARDHNSDNGSDARKRKGAVQDNDESSVPAKETKKVETKAAASSSSKATTKKAPIREGSFTNTSMPTSLNLPEAPEGCIKITSWNVSGLNASLKKGFKTYINAEDADVICLQEHKVNQPLLNLVDPKVYPFSWWGFEQDKKGYAGVAMFSKTKPISVTAGLPTHPNPEITKGRVVTLEYPTSYLIGCYVPNAGQGLVRLKERMIWDVAMNEWLLQLKEKGKHIIWTGDLNVCHKPIDLRNPATNAKSAGFTKEERDGFSKILKDVDLVDTFREIQGEDESAGGQYSYFSYRFQCRVKGIGWRLDYFVTDKEMMEKRVVESTIREECYGASDHVPIVLVVRGEL